VKSDHETICESLGRESGQDNQQESDRKIEQREKFYKLVEACKEVAVCLRLHCQIDILMVTLFFLRIPDRQSSVSISGRGFQRGIGIDT